MDAQTVTDMILMTDARYAPILILMGVIIPFVISYGRVKLERSEKNKELARQDGSEVGPYETKILGGNLAVAAIIAAATLIIPGMYFTLVGAEQNDGIYLIGLAVAILGGWFADEITFRYVESSRNDKKADEARAEKKATE